jgi:hypothetical protein
MKRIIYTFLGLMLTFTTAFAQIYSATSETGTRYNPGLNKIAMDDLGVKTSVVGVNNAINYTQVKVGIRRLVGAPAVDVTIYAFDFVRNIIYTLGVQSLPAYTGTASETTIVTLGDGVATLHNGFFTTEAQSDTVGFRSLYIGVKFSESASGLQGWRVTNYPTAGGNSASSWGWYLYDQSVTPATLNGFVFGGATPGCFYAQIFGTATIPIELKSFSGKYANNVNNLVWETASEINNDYYEVQRRFRSADWVTIGTLKGAGTTAEARKYQFVDANVVAGEQYYYRLVDHSNDGNKNESKIISIETGNLGNIIRHYPLTNPIIDNKVEINCTIPTDSKVTINVSDASGRIVRQDTYNNLTAGEHLLEIGNTTWASGMYIYSISTDKGLSATGKFVKN